MSHSTGSAAFALWLILAALPLQSAAHSPSRVEASEQTAAFVNPPQRQRTARPVGFDWLANRPDPSQRRAAPLAGQRRAPGNGSYICSAAGFGEMSRCTER